MSAGDVLAGRSDWSIDQGDVLERLACIADESIDCVVTSPPYWGLRDYGLPPGVWGGHPECEHEWGEGLRIHKGGPHGDGVMLAGGRAVIEAQAAAKKIDAGRFCRCCGAWLGSLGLEPTWPLYVDHVATAFREVRRVLRRSGVLWLNLGDCYATGAGAVGQRPGGGRRGRVWAEGVGPMTQPNRMPQPGLKRKDLVGIPWRVAFALQEQGWWLRSDVIWSKPNPMPESVADRPTRSHEYVFLLTKSARYWYDADAIREPDAGQDHRRTVVGPIYDVMPGAGPHHGIRTVEGRNGADRNKRSVWTIATAPFPEAHFATFPPALVEPCVLAGCPVGGIVLDPFAGSGTTVMVALRHGRRGIGFDLSPAYVEMAQRRIVGDAPLFNGAAD